jgi:hypothetical protein
MNYFPIMPILNLNDIKNEVENEFKQNKYLPKSNSVLEKNLKTPFYKESTFGRFDRKRFPKRNNDIQILYL